MAEKVLNILYIEDSEQDALLLNRHLLQCGYTVDSERVDTGEAMRAALESREWDLILSDYSMPRFDAIKALYVLKESGKDIPFIIISGTIGEYIAVEAMRLGASDYFMKDSLARLVPAIERELQESENRRAKKRAEDEQRRLNTQIKSQSERLNNVVANVPGIVWETSGVSESDQTINFVSEYVETMLGYSVEEWLSTPNFWLTIVHPDDRERVETESAAIFTRKQDHGTIEFRWIAKDKRVRWVQSKSAVVLNEVGEPIGLRGVTIDITDKKKAELALQASEHRLRMVTDNARVGLVMVNHERRYTFANAAYIEILDLPQDHIVGLRIADVLPSVYDEQIGPRLERAFAGERVSYELHKRTGGIERTYAVRYEPTVAHDSEPLVVVVITDITEIKQAEEAVRESEERYRLLFTSNPIPMWVYGLETLKFLEVNDAAVRHYGYSKKEFCSMMILDIRPDEDAVELKKKIANINSPFGTTEICRHRKKDGNLISVEITAHSLDFNGVPSRLVLANDVTERRSLEEQLRQSQKMEAIGMLVGGIAHDFNNLLTAINGYSELALKQMSDDEPLHQNVDEIYKAGKRAAALTGQLLAFGRKQVLLPKVINLNSIILEIEKMLRRLIGEDVGLQTALDSELGNVMADPGQIEQVLLNLVINARDAMPDGGQLTIETKNVFLDEDYARIHISVLPGHYVMMGVSDTGTGIDDPTLERIFEPFFSTKEPGKGTGLGLSTTYGIVKQSGGSIWVYSEPDKGTTFKIYFPRIHEDRIAYVARSDNTARMHGTETILLTEDEEIVRKLAKQVLEMYGYNVLVADRGKAALSISEEYGGHIDLLITDVIMPGMSGRDLSNQILMQRPDIKILYMSGYTDNAIVHHGVIDGEASFIQKPFSTDGLARKIRETLDARLNIH